MRTFKTRIKTRRYLLLAILAIVSLTTAPAPKAALIEQPPNSDRVALYQALLDLTNPWTVMCVAAHPDDEDGTSLIVMRRKYGAHTVSLFSTFGEGGQNAIGPELYEELGAIRARETMAASEIQGSEPHFLGLKDFGFSKSPDETFQKWGHEEALRRMVLEIRKLRPDVIITNHSVTNNDHGHHQATARLAVEAFDAAADPKRFPEQLKDGVDTWQVQRLFVRARRSQNNQPDTDTSPVVTLDPNEQDPVRGVTFAEQALSALQKHATQGPWPKSVAQMASRFANSNDGRLPLIRYRLAKEAKGAEAISKDSNTFLDGLQLRESVGKQLAPPTIEGRPLTAFIDERDRLFDALEAAAKRFNTPTEPAGEARRSFMLHRFEYALQNTSGINARLVPRNQVVVPGERATFDLVISNHGDLPAQVGLIGTGQGKRDGKVSLFANTVAKKTIAPGHDTSVPLVYEVPNDARVTVPHAEHLYDENASGFPFAFISSVTVRGVNFFVSGFSAMDVAPPIEIAEISPHPVVILRPRVGVSSAGADTFPAIPPKVSVKLLNHTKRPFQGEVAFGFENRSPENRVRVDLLPEQTTSLAVTIPNTEENRAAHLRRPELANSLWFALRNAGQHENLIKRSVPVVWLDANVSQKVSVGYVRGFDFSLPNALTALGVESKELSVAEVNNADLGKFTSIIVDNRVYESQPDLIAANQKLLDFAKNGGTLIVFYHKTNEWNPDPRRNRPQLAPYKLIISDDRVTDENAPITFLEPNHPLLNSPNKMGSEDFVEWIQERGVYYPKEWDPQFHALLQSNDPGEAPLKGGLLVADYGKGKYIYTSMVWYRQLRAGVPGAYRMLANMISYGR
ncbi:MAG TPA: PIG-L family deacetylase [Pyrinomonadaceae bacterium]